MLLAGRILQIVIVTESFLYKLYVWPPSKEKGKTCCQHVQTRSRYKRYCNHVTDARYAVARWAAFTVKSGRLLISNLKKKRKKQGAFLLSHLKRRLFSKTLPGVEFFVIAGRKRAVFKPMISYIKSTVIAC